MFDSIGCKGMRSGRASTSIASPDKAVFTDLAEGVASASGSPQSSAGNAFPALTLGRYVRDLSGHRANERLRDGIHASSYASTRPVRLESMCLYLKT